MNRLSTLALLALASLAAGLSTAAAQNKLTVAVGGRGIGESCLTEIGLKAGLFARHGLDINLVYTDGGGETQQAVVSNSAQIGVTSGMLGAMSLYAKGAPVRVIGSSYSGGSQIYWYVPANSPVKTPQDLDGKSVSYSNFSSASHVGLLALQKYYKLNFKLARFDAYAKFSELSAAQAKRALSEFLPRAALDPGRITGIDEAMADAVTYKFIAAPLSKAQVTELIQLPGRKP
jgi:ABC-type nitrate/sulfonate/bicarbonate transport system substrate-binding protein